jgi:glutathione S-transferase
MSIVLYYGSGSPFAWRVQLALEHKALPYERRVLSFSAGETRKPEFLALNPRHRVPVIVDGDFVLYESNAIVEYLDEAYPGRGAPLFPGDARRRALIRRLIMEADHYFDKAIDPVVDYAFAKDPAKRDAQKFADGKAAVAEECALFARSLAGEFLAGPLSAADYALYPTVAFLDRCKIKLPDFDPLALMPAPFAAWKARVEALPHFAATIPPHWQKKD